MSLNDKFKEAIPIIDKLEANGFEAYFVGGSVRDSLLNLPIHDVDIATSAFPNEIKNIFRRTVDVGIEHGTVMVLVEDIGYEITTFRTESTYQDFRRPDHVTFVRSLEEDLMRRDFTINALAMDKEGTVYDYFNGLEDLDNRLIRAVCDPYTRFHEDALRMMRAVRFQATLGFDIEPKTFDAIEKNNEILSKIAVERIHEEFIKMMKGKHARAGLTSFIETELYNKCPFFSDKEAALRKLTNRHGVIQTEVQVWALLGYFAGLKDLQLTEVLRAWKSSNAVISASNRALNGLRDRLSDELSLESIYDLGSDLLKEIEWMVYLITGEPYNEDTIEVYKELPIHNRNELAVDGGILMKALDRRGGPWLGEILDDIERKVLYKKLTNDKDTLLGYAQTTLQK